MQPPHKFIAFEGGNGTGKSTQLKLLNTFLQERGQSVLVCNDPGTTELGQLVRKSLKNDDPEFKTRKLVDDFFLTGASKVELWHRVILPALEAGQWVLVDRFSLSSQVYEGVLTDNEKDRQAYFHLMDSMLEGRWPITFILDARVETALTRARQRDNKGESTRFERMELEKHERIRMGYRSMPRFYRGCYLINANQAEEAVSAEILELVETIYNI